MQFCQKQADLQGGFRKVPRGVNISFENLKQYPSVRYRLNKGDLTVKAWLFDMHEGSLLEYDESSDQFQTIG